MKTNLLQQCERGNVDEILIQVSCLEELHKQMSRAKQYVELVANDEVLGVLVPGLADDLKELKIAIGLLNVYIDLGVKYAECA